jgi:hypothetical protein
MKKKFFSKLLMVALVATVGVFSSCKDYDDDIADVRKDITQTATELRTDYTNKINVVNTTVEKLQTSFDNLDAAYKKADEALTTLINTRYSDAVATAQAYSDANLLKAKDAAAAAEAAAKAYAEQQAAAAQTAAIAAAKEQVAAAKAELEAALAKANELIATQGQSISNLIEADKVLEAAIKAAQARADEAFALADKANTLAETNKANLAKAAADITALQQSLSALESKAADKADVAKLQSDLAALQKQVSENVVNLASFNEEIGKINSELGLVKKDLESQKSLLQGEIDKVRETANGNLAQIESILKQLQALAETNNKAHETINLTLQDLQSQITNNKGEAATALENAVASINAQFEATKSLIDANTSAIATLTQTVADNKKAADGTASQLAEEAKKIAENSKAIQGLKDLIPGLESTLKSYADKVAAEKAADALGAAKQFALDQIAAQAKQDKENLSAFVNEVFQTLIKTYEVNVLAGLLDNTRKDAEKNAEQRAQEISNEALKQANLFAQNLNDQLALITPTKDDMDAAIKAAKESAIAQAYVKVLNDLLRDQKEWYNQSDEDKLLQPSPTIYDVAVKAVNEYGLSKDNAEELINKIIDEALQPTIEPGMGVEAKEGGKIMVLIEAAAKKAADDLAEVNEALDARLDDIEAFLKTTAKDNKTIDAVINWWIAEAKLAKQVDVDDLKAQLAGTKDSELLTKITAAKALADENAANIGKVMTTINNVASLFSFLNEGSEDEPTIDDQLQAYYNVMEKLANRIKGMADVVDNLGAKVLEALNKNLGPQTQNMITSIHLFANQHHAAADQYGKIKAGDYNDNDWLPFGYDNFDHTLTFVYAIEKGLKESCATGKGDPTSWNYPAGLLEQLKGIESERDTMMKNDYDFTYEDVPFTGAERKFDFVEGRYYSEEDAILVRVSPTTADLTKAEDITLLNSLNQDIVKAGLITITGVKPYDKLITGDVLHKSEATRAEDEGPGTGLWVISFKLNDENPDLATLWKQYSSSKDGDILYSVAVKNTNFSAVDEEGNHESEDDGISRYVVSEYDLDLALEEAAHAWDFTVNDIDINEIHNRYIQPEQALTGTSNWDDDPFDYTGSFRYELTWTDWVCDEAAPQPQPTPGDDDDDEEAEVGTWYQLCNSCWYYDDGQNNPDCPRSGRIERAGWTNIKFLEAQDSYGTGVKDDNVKGVNTIDRLRHTFTNSGHRQARGVDNRHLKDMLPIYFSADQAPEGETGEWAKIKIEFPKTNACGQRTSIKGFFVTLDNHFALESNNSEVNSWATYEYDGVAFYNYDQHKKETDPAYLKDVKVEMKKGNVGYIYIKNAHNVTNDEVIGFRVHAVNLDGTFTDPDGRAFYVVNGNPDKKHELSFDITVEKNEEAAYAVQNKVDGVNPIAAYNEKQVKDKSSVRFFDIPAYNASFEFSNWYRAILVWRADNPAIRAYGNSSTTAYWPVEETGRNYINANGDEGTYVKQSGYNTPYPSNSFDVENFFSFYYSSDANAKADDPSIFDDSKNYTWVPFGFTDVDGYYQPSKRTNSVRAAINPNMANRLIDGATYKVKMILQRLDNQTTWTTVNIYDIDITKQMPTEMPSKFKVKSKQLTDGKWQFYLRPLAAQGDNPDEVNPWTITWADYAQAWIADAKGDDAKKAAFATNFNGDIDKNITPAGKVTPSFHMQRWGSDARPYNFEEMFEGLFIDDPDAEDPTPILDPDYYFYFAESGDFVAADRESDWVASDDQFKNSPAIASFQQYDNADINPDALSHADGAYRLPPIHWSHLGQTKDVSAGYIYRNISANLDKDGKYFLDPQAEKDQYLGKSIKNSDLVIDPVAVKVNGKQLQATYSCAWDAGVTLRSSNGLTTLNNKVQQVANEFKYNDDVNVAATSAIFNLSAAKWEAGATEEVTINGVKENVLVQAYFDSKLPEIGLLTPKDKDGKATTDVTKIVNGIDLATMIQYPYVWIDVNSITLTDIKVDGKADASYDYTHYYYEPFFTSGNEDSEGKPARLTEDETFRDITGIAMLRKARTTGNPAFNSAITGAFAFDVYDVWFHKKTVKVTFKIIKPEGGNTSRQAR